MIRPKEGMTKWGQGLQHRGSWLYQTWGKKVWQKNKKYESQNEKEEKERGKFLTILYFTLG